MWLGTMCSVFAKPEVGDLGEDLALVGDGRRKHVVEGRYAVAGDDEQVLSTGLVDVTHLAPAQEAEDPVPGTGTWRWAS